MCSVGHCALCIDPLLLSFLFLFSLLLSFLVDIAWLQMQIDGQIHTYTHTYGTVLVRLLIHATRYSLTVNIRYGARETLACGCSAYAYST